MLAVNCRLKSSMLMALFVPLSWYRCEMGILFSILRFNSTSASLYLNHNHVIYPQVIYCRYLEPMKILRRPTAPRKPVAVPLEYKTEISIYSRYGL